MKKLFLVLFLFAGLSVQSFAATAVEKMDVVNDDKESIEILVSTDLVAAIDGEDTASDEEELFECWIHNVHCMCGFFVTQYCNEGLHGTTQQWEAWICSQAECDQPEP